MLTAIRSPIIGMPAAPLTAGLSIVVPVVRIGGSPSLLPAALAFPLAGGGGAERLARRLRTRVKEFATGSTTPLFHTRPLFDGYRFRESRPAGLYQQRRGLWVRNCEQHYGECRGGSFLVSRSGSIRVSVKALGVLCMPRGLFTRDEAKNGHGGHPSRIAENSQQIQHDRINRRASIKED